MNREYRESLSYSLEKKFIRLEERIMRDVIRRLRKTGEITSSADWQLLRYHLLGNSTADIEKEIKKCLDDSYPLVFEAYDRVLEKEYVRYAPLYEQINEEIISFDDNKELHQLIDTLQNQSNQELFNITKSLGFAIPDPVTKKVLFTPLLDFYNGVLDDAMLDIASGAFDYESTIRKVVKQMVNSGLRTVAYGSGWSNRVDVAARRAVMTGISQMTGQISFMNAEKLGTDYYEVAWHSGARPTHAVWQGKVWTSSQLVSVCGYGTVTGLCGANCYHEFYPFIPGISERNWSDEWLEAQNRKEDSSKEYGDKSYTAYEARQQQRKMETAMRAQREKVSLLKEAGVNEDDILNAQIKYNNQLYEYARFSNKMGLKQQRQRIYSDMRGRIATNTKRQNAKYSPEMIKNASRDSKQYYKYKSIIGDSVGSLADFRQMKYNKSKEFELLIDYTNSVKRGMISPLSGFRNYKNLYEKIEKEIIGIETATGVKITGQSKHFMERVIGTKEDPKTHRPRSGVSIEDIQDALLNGEVKRRKRDPNSIKFVTDNCIVSVNPNTEILIQCNPQ